MYRHHTVAVGLGLLVLSAGAGPLLALDPGLPIERYGRDLWSLEEGLPQSTVQEILQTRDGYLWLGTEEGLARFDGLTFTGIGAAPELRNLDIRSLLEEPDGSLLIGTWDGLHRWREGRISHLPRADGRSFGTVESLWRSSDGTLWIGTQDEGLVARTAGGGERVVTTADGLPDNSVWALWQGEDDVLWIGTDGGLARLAGGRIESLAGRAGLPWRVAAIRPARGGGFWVAGHGGVSLCRSARCEQRVPGSALLDERIHAFWEDREGNLWIGSREGLDRVRRTPAGFAPAEGLALGYVRALWEGREGSLWIGTNLGGLHRLRNRSFTTLGTTDGLQSPRVYSPTEDAAGTLWVGTAGGLARGRGERFEPVTDAGLPLGGVAPVFAMRSGAVWLGLRDGVARLEGGRTRLFGPADGWHAGGVNAFFEDLQGTLWIGTQQGIFRHERDPAGVDRFVPAIDPERLPCPEVLAITGSRRGGMWLGLDGCGLVHLAGGRVRQAFTAADGLGANTVNAVYEDASGTVWAATKGGGLSWQSSDRRPAWTTVAKEQGLPSDNLFQILDDGRGFLWLTSNRGVVRLAKAALADFAANHGDLPLTVYGAADGMGSAECNGQRQPAGWRGRDGRLWFPTVAGLAVVDPKKVEESAPPFPVIIERLAVDRGPLRPARELRFSPGTRRVEIAPGARRLEIEYTALTFLAPERVRFRVRLHGFEDEWREVGARRSTGYTNLPPGDYRFEVRAAGRDGVWRQEAEPIVLVLEPYLYEQTWFYPLVALLLAGAGWLAYRWRMRQLHRRFDLVVAERNRIGREIHDVLAQGMTGAALQLDGAAEALAAEPREAVTHLERARELLRGAMAAARRSVWNLRAAELERKDLGAALQEMAARLVSAQGPRIEARVTGPAEGLPEDVEEHLFRVAQEAVTNALKHAAARRIAIDLAVEEGRAVLRIRDDGRGFSPAADRAASAGAEPHFGLAGMWERAEAVGGTLTLDTAPGGGTRVEIAVPLPRDESPNL